MRSRREAFVPRTAFVRRRVEPPSAARRLYLYLLKQIMDLSCQRKVHKYLHRDGTEQPYSSTILYFT